MRLISQAKRIVDSFLRATLLAMRFWALVLAVALMPWHVLALNYTDQSLLYNDAPFLPAEAAGISVLTSLGAVQGYPDGTFQPDKNLNRAEYLKIVLMSSPSIRVSPSDAGSCFPDVNTTDWFSQYVCLALKRGIVEGYPDGNFKPGNNVNYVEALKMLSEMYDYSLTIESGEEWYMPYVNAAEEHGTILPINLPADHLLTRGEMARLAAAYRAEHEGELDKYRAFERGETITDGTSSSSSSSTSSSASSTSSAGSASSSSVASSSAGQQSGAFKTVSRILVSGQRSKSVADARFTSYNEDTYLRQAVIKLDKRADYVSAFHLLDSTGKQIGEFRADSSDPNDKTWKLDLDSGAYTLKKGAMISLGVEVTLDAAENGGLSEQLLEVRDFYLMVQGVTSNQSTQLVATAPVFPIHQTAYGKITGARNALSDTGNITPGIQKFIGAFTLTGATTVPNPLTVKEINFTYDASYGVALANVQVTGEGCTEWRACTKTGTNQYNCILTEDLGKLGGGLKTLQIYADIVLGGVGDNRTIQVSLEDPGAIGRNGAVIWSDSVGRFTWLPDFKQPIAKSTLWKIEE